MFAGFFHHQLEPQFEIGRQFPLEFPQRNRVIYKLFHHEVNSVFLEDDVDIVGLVEFQFDFLDLVIAGFDALENLTQIRNPVYIKGGQDIQPRGRHAEVVFVGQNVVVFTDIGPDGFLFGPTQAFELTLGFQCAFRGGDPFENGLRFPDHHRGNRKLADTDRGQAFLKRQQSPFDRTDQTPGAGIFGEGLTGQQAQGLV
ncbi:MAG: hypothetical protein JJV98_12360, partial [Desulfosarcina sp.]|nr:hypothetical protein [Desulfobacterales bacterium]